jgi:hypothetical protein
MNKALRESLGFPLSKRKHRLPQIMTERALTSGVTLQLCFDYFTFDLLEYFRSFVRI